MPLIPRYCPLCATALQTRPQGVAQEPRLSCPSCSFVHFDNPAPCAGVLVEDEQGRVLLGRRGHAPYKGWWGVLGGFVEGKEHPCDTARRELLEEVGLEVGLHGLLGMWMDRYGKHGDFTVNLVFVGYPLNGSVPRTSVEVTELGWFPHDALPARIAFASGRAAVHAWARWRGELSRGANLAGGTSASSLREQAQLLDTSMVGIGGLLSTSPR